MPLAILAVSTGAPFAKWAAPASPVAIAAIRVCLAAVLLLVVGWREVGQLVRILRDPKRPGQRVHPAIPITFAGILLGIHFGSWIASLSFTSTAASVALVCTNPIFAALFGSVLGDRVTRREAWGIAIAAIGCIALAGGDWSAGGDALFGDGLAVIGAASAAGYLVVGRGLRASVPLLPYLGCVNAIAGIGLLITAISLHTDLAALPSHTYLACAGAAIVASLLGHSLLNAAVRTTPTHLVALAVLGEPIISSLITWGAFGEQPPLHAVAGGAVVLAGIGVGFARPTRA